MMNLDLNVLLDYTEWERQTWRDHMTKQGEHVLAIGIGPNGDGRFQTVGEIIRHIFSAETRYADRLAGRELTDTSNVPANHIDALFAFGKTSRANLRELLATFPAAKWDEMQEFRILTSVVTASPKKIVIHALLHEVRHWAQMGTLMRLNGLAGGFHDFLMSPVLGGGIRRESATSS